MIVGIGSDIIEIERIQKALLRPLFLKRVFTENEIELYEKRKQNPSVLAGNFAVKESVSKVFGTGVQGFLFTDIEVLRDAKGKPYVNLFREAKAISENLGIERLHVSLSHHQTAVVAFAVGESL